MVSSPTRIAPGLNTPTTSKSGREGAIWLGTKIGFSAKRQTEGSWEGMASASVPDRMQRYEPKSGTFQPHAHTDRL
jgi:hypothetical protein